MELETFQPAHHREIAQYRRWYGCNNNENDKIFNEKINQALRYKHSRLTKIKIIKFEQLMRHSVRG